MQEIVSIIVFLVVIIAIMTEKVHRSAAALAGAVVLLLTRVLDFDAAVGYIDFNTIGVLIGMMLFVAVVKNSGLFEYIAIKAAKMAKGDPWKIMAAFIVITAFLSGFLDNVTTVLLVGPMTITIARMLRINPVPFLITQIFASNIGGTATLIGDPPNIMIGSAAGLTFIDFVANTGIVAVVSIVVLLIAMKILYGTKMKADVEAIESVAHLDESKAIEDHGLLVKSIVMVVIVVFAFIFHSQIGVDTATIALTCAAVMMVIGGQDIDDIISEVEWSTILFFTMLFVVVGGMVETGVIGELANVVLNVASGHQIIMMMILLWASALFSSVLDNIPFVATLIPLVTALGESGVDIEPLWWAISLGACFGGNGTLIGASANVVLSGISNKHGYPITFATYTKVGFPVMIMTVVLSTIFLLLKFGM
ncbi:MAG TPA: ArsB/NhaD family transporter [Candidatus Avanaerovorax faecigallinarum]|nr:ArsB/NhaD family transporter [Candidatus Avanaerovorax faecigallinarum]